MGCCMCRDMKLHFKMQIREVKKQLWNGKTLLARANSAYTLWYLYGELNTFWSRLKAWSFRREPLVIVGAARACGENIALVKLNLKKIPKRAQTLLTQIEQTEKERKEREDQNYKIGQLEHDLLAAKRREENHKHTIEVLEGDLRRMREEGVKKDKKERKNK